MPEITCQNTKTRNIRLDELAQRDALDANLTTVYRVYTRDLLAVAKAVGHHWFSANIVRYAECHGNDSASLTL